MAYTYTSEGEQFWDYSSRDEVIRWRVDPQRGAAEQFARRVEEYLYDRRSPVFRDDVFLAWSVAMYDAEKTGSGRYIDSAEYDPERAARQVIPPVDQRNPRAQQDIEPRLPAEALTLFSEEATS